MYFASSDEAMTVQKELILYFRYKCRRFETFPFYARLKPHLRDIKVGRTLAIFCHGY